MNHQYLIAPHPRGFFCFHYEKEEAQMTFAQLNAAVARATGEEIDVIAGRGFSLVEDRPPTTNEEWEELALDWDELESQWCGHEQWLAA